MYRDISSQDTVSKQYAKPGNLDARIALHTRFSTNPLGWQRWLFSQYDFPAGSEILEAGCGTGSLWSGNIDRMDKSWRLTLIDLSGGMLEKAREALQGILPNMQFILCDIQSLPFEPRSFDTVIANHMLYHVPDIGRALFEARRVLKDGGTFYTTANSIDSMAGLYDLIPLLDLQDVSEQIANVQKFTMENGSSFLSEHFGNVETLIYDDSLHITEAQPLLDYILSMMIDFKQLAMEEGRRQALAVLEGIIAEQGAIDISKQSGVFICRK